MPPHKEMCLVQLLLIRSLVAVFWKNPYKNKLIHWGTDLHNKFMLHHFVKEDMYEVINHLNRYDIAFDKSWLDVFLEFRFPIYGKVNVEGVNITLRSGIEPWIVLGEEMSSSGTARFVDSSVEKLEILVEDFNPERYMVLCNSIKIPLVKTNYGCTYHVVHPGGRGYDTFPVNSLEAESRRTTRFWEFNHSPKSEAALVNPTIKTGQTTNYVTTNNTVKEEVDVRYIPISPEFPHTLDLRRS